jgi:hypothetical protein
MARRDAAALAVARHVRCRHEQRALVLEAQHMPLGEPAHAHAMEVSPVEVLVDVEGDVTVLDLLEHVPLEEAAEGRVRALVVVEPALDHLQSELRGVGLEALRVAHAEALAVVAEKSFQLGA